MSNTIRKITSARVTTYDDNGQTIVYIGWLDQRNEEGRTAGSLNNMHMRELLKRAEREGVTIAMY